MSVPGRISNIRFIRLSKIHNEINAGSYPNCTKLSKLCGVGTRSIHDDITFLRDTWYAPIEYDEHKKGYYYTEPYTPTFIEAKIESAKMDQLDKETYAKFIDVPISFIDKLEEITDLGIQSQTIMQADIGNKYCGRCYYDGTVWIGIKTFQISQTPSEYQFCISFFESYKDKNKKISCEIQSRHQNYICEDCPVDGGYWLYIILDKNLLNYDIAIAQTEISKMLTFFEFKNDC